MFQQDGALSNAAKVQGVLELKKYFSYHTCLFNYKQQLFPFVGVPLMRPNIFQDLKNALAHI